MESGPAGDTMANVQHSSRGDFKRLREGQRKQAGANQSFTCDCSLVGNKKALHPTTIMVGGG